MSIKFLFWLIPQTSLLLHFKMIMHRRTLSEEENLFKKWKEEKLHAIFNPFSLLCSLSHSLYHSIAAARMDGILKFLLPSSMPFLTLAFLFFTIFLLYIFCEHTIKHRSCNFKSQFMLEENKINFHIEFRHFFTFIIFFSLILFCLCDWIIRETPLRGLKSLI